jgi:glycosyltransferase involved in cell wall biosynthesis
MKKISIVVPIYNESNNINKLFLSLQSVILTIPHVRWEYIFVNDGSIDDSCTQLRKLLQAHSNITILDFSRNFGKEVALTAGVHEAVNSDAVICIDADLQHPPELIPKLVNKWEDGAEIVECIRLDTVNQAFLRKIGSLTFYWLMNKISGIKMNVNTTDFRLYDKIVIKSFILATERNRIFRGIMDWMGYRHATIEFTAGIRSNDQVASYSYIKLFNLAVNSLTAFSLWPLKITGYLGLLISTISGSLAFWMMISYVVQTHFNYTPLAIFVVLNTFLIGLTLIAIGLVAFYVGIIHTEVLNRPLYIIRARITNDSK